MDEDICSAGLADKPKIAYELLNLKAKILAKQGDKDGAIAAAKESNELAIKAEGAHKKLVGAVELRIDESARSMASVSSLLAASSCAVRTTTLCSSSRLS